MLPIVESALAMAGRRFALTLVGLIPGDCGRGIVRLASGHEAGANSWVLVSAYDAGAAVDQPDLAGR